MTNAYDFPVTYTCRRDDCDDAFREMAVEQVLKLSKYHGRITDAGITINGKQPSTKVEITLRIPGAVLVATHEDFNRMVAFDGAIEKMKNQIKRFKERIAEHRPPAPVEPESGDMEETA